MIRFLFSALALGGAAFLSGCGDKAEAGATVTGTVTLRDGKPLPGGRIDFRAASGNTTSGQIKADGKYEVSGLTPGDYKVSVENVFLKGTGKTPPGLAPMPTDNSGTKYVPFDGKYSKPESSGLTTTVSGDAHSFDVQLK